MWCRFTVEDSGVTFQGVGCGNRSQFQVSGFGCRVSGFVSRFSGFRFRVSGFGSRVSGLGFRVACLGLRDSCLGFRVSGLGSRVSGLDFRVSGLGFRVSGLGLRISCLGFRASDLGFRVSGFGFRVLGSRFWGQSTLDLKRSNCRKQSRTWSTSQVLHVLESQLLACIPPELRKIDFAIALWWKEKEPGGSGGGNRGAPRSTAARLPVRHTTRVLDTPK